MLNFNKLFLLELPYILSPEMIVLIILLACVVIALFAFRINYRAQIKVALIMDNETDVYNKKGFELFLKKKGKKFSNPTLVVIEIKNLGFLYTSYLYKYKMMYAITNCLLQGLSKKETVARVEFGRFIVLLEGKTKAEVQNYCSGVEEKLEHLYFENYGLYNFVLNFGVYEHPDLKRTDSIVGRTIAILIYSKVKEKNIYYYSDDVEETVNKMQVINNIKQSALEDHQFVPYVQPKVDFKTGKVVGGEILVRWVDSNFNILYNPNDFIPLFENNGFVKKIDMEMFEQTCKLAQTLIQRGYKDIILSVNVSKINFDSPTYIDDITKIISKYSISPANIEIEITETATMESSQYVSNYIMQLRQLGYHLAMDDFGKEYSSLGSLANTPFDVIKMDMVFFQNSLQTEKEKIIVSNVLNLLGKLKCEIVCEGIRDKQTLDALATMNRDIILQGFYFSKPIPTSQFEAFLNTSFDFDYPDIVKVEESNNKGSKISYSEIDVLKQEMEKMRQEIRQSKENDFKNNESSYDYELRRLREELEIEKQRLKREREEYELKKLREELESLKNNQISSNENNSDIELKKLKEELRSLKINRVNNNKNSEIKKIREELEFFKNNQNGTDDSDLEINSLREELEDIKANTNTNTNSNVIYEYVDSNEVEAYQDDSLEYYIESEQEEYPNESFTEESNLNENEASFDDLYSLDEYYTEEIVEDVEEDKKD